MKSPLISRLAICLWLFASGIEARAQLSVPPNPSQVTQRKLGESGGGADVGVRPREPAPPVVIHYVAVSPVRGWRNASGKEIQARLLAFSAPAEGEIGAVEVIREGKVRFLLVSGKEPIDYPLAELSESDQDDIKAIAKAAAGGPPKPAGEADVKSGEEKSEP